MVSLPASLPLLHLQGSPTPVRHSGRAAPDPLCHRGPVTPNLAGLPPAAVERIFPRMQNAKILFSGKNVGSRRQGGKAAGGRTLPVQPELGETCIVFPLWRQLRHLLLPVLKEVLGRRCDHPAMPPPPLPVGSTPRHATPQHTAPHVTSHHTVQATPHRTADTSPLVAPLPVASQTTPSRTAG